MNETKTKKRRIAPVYRKVDISEQRKSDREDWLSRSPEDRLAALTKFRQAYNSWKYPGKGF